MLKNLRKLREEKGLSQEALANAVGVTQGSINKYENYDTHPDLAIVISLADYFQTSVDYLVGRSEVRQKADEIIKHGFTAEEFHFMEKLRDLSDEKQKYIIHSVDVFGDGSK